MTEQSSGQGLPAVVRQLRISLDLETMQSMYANWSFSWSVAAGDIWEADIKPFYAQRDTNLQKAPPKYADLVLMATQGYKPNKGKKTKKSKEKNPEDKENEDPLVNEVSAAVSLYWHLVPTTVVCTEV